MTATFARALSADDVDDAWTPDDVLRIARVRGQAEAAILSQLMFDAARAARAMGSRSSNVREYARQLRAKPGVLALPVDPSLGARPTDLVAGDARADDLRAAAARGLAPVG
ncbi:MAG: hypothetical protein LH650_02170 [Chloroflexi bacterium]|nr:hypothetical protein [Chloroflexota bacterium]